MNRFHIDDTSRVQAREMVAVLQRQQLHTINNEIPRMLRTFVQGSFLNEIASEFSSPLKRIREQIPIDDLKRDIQDFGLMVAIAERSTAQLPVIRIGLRTVPILPPEDSLNSVPFYQLFSSSNESILQQLTGLGSTETPFRLRRAEFVRRIFFRRLERFLSVRMAGTRWMRNQYGLNTSSYNRQTMTLAAGAGATGGGSGGSSSQGLRSTQEWTIHTKGSGYSIFYGGSHAIRTRPIYLNAPTTPVQVFLPMGTVLLAADAGGDGEYVWDSSVITVPSQTPVYYTKKF